MYKEGELRKNRLEELKTRIEKEEQAKVDRSRSAPKKRNEQFSPYRLERGTEEIGRLQEKRSPKAEPQPILPKPEPRPTVPKAESGKPTKPQGSKPSTAPGSKPDPPPKPVKHGDVLRTIYEELTSKS